MLVKNVKKAMKRAGWNMKFDAREEAIIEDVTRIVSHSVKAKQLEPLITKDITMQLEPGLKSALSMCEADAGCCKFSDEVLSNRNKIAISARFGVVI